MKTPSITLTEEVRMRMEQVATVLLAILLHGGVIYYVSATSTVIMPPSAAPAISVELALSAEPSVAAASPPAQETKTETETAPQESTPPPEPETPTVVPQETPAPEAVKKPPEKKPVAKAPARKAPTAEPPRSAAQNTATPSSHPTSAAVRADSGAPAASEGAMTPASATADHLNNPPPQYPALALKRKWQGTVQLRVQVLESGRPGEIQIVRSSGRDILDQAAVAAVRQWSFVAARRGGTPMESWASFPLSFKLQ